MLKDMESGVAFYRDGLGLSLRRASDSMAEFDTGGR
jgi:catechol 2,3-dioxygenase-like lactoylglutathione lyase family enzyme